MTDADIKGDLLAALVRARHAAEDHMSARERDGSSWKEETVTELLCVHAAPFITYADFTKRQEKVVGADGLWWWIDDTDVSFGMLVQAKRLKHIGSRLTIDLRYPNGTGEQMNRLFRTADLFKVPAVYILYFGGPQYRKYLTCGAQHMSVCVRCQKASVSILSGFVAELISLDPVYVAEDSFRESFPLEYLADPKAAPDLIKDLNLRSLDSDLRTFLELRQAGARHVARMIFKSVSERRRGQFALAVADSIDTDNIGLFSNLPRDRGHFRAPYFEHILRGLRRGIPSYVQDVLAGRKPPDSVTQHLGGIVIVRC